MTLQVLPREGTLATDDGGPSQDTSSSDHWPDGNSLRASTDHYCIPRAAVKTQEHSTDHGYSRGVGGISSECRTILTSGCAAAGGIVTPIAGQRLFSTLAYGVS